MRQFTGHICSDSNSASASATLNFGGLIELSRREKERRETEIDRDSMKAGEKDWKRGR